MEFDCLDFCRPCLWTTASYGRMVACVFGKRIRLYSGTRVFRNFQGHKATILTVSVDPFNGMQLLSVDADGNVFTWDIMRGKRIAKKRIPLSDIDFAQITRESVVIAKIDQKGQSAKVRVQSFQWMKGSVDTSSPFLEFTCPASPSLGTKALCVGSEGRYIAIVSALLTIDIYSLAEPNKKARVSITSDNLTRKAAITTVALHPSEREVAGGLTTGELCLWRFHEPSLQSKDDVEVKESRKRKRDGSAPDSGYAERRMHWHALAIQCLGYSESGMFLFSGGHEAVLVQWDLTEGGASSTRKKLLPRLHSPIHSVGALAADCVYVMLTNRILHLLRPGTGLELVQEVRGRLLRGVPTVPGLTCRWHSGGIVSDPRDNSVVLGSQPGHIQWVGCDRKELDITNENYVALAPPRDDLWRSPVSSCATEVTQLALGIDTMATWETLILGDSDSRVQRIKWWRRGNGVEDWSLMQCSNVSHLGQCYNLSFSPSGRELALGLYDGRIALFGETQEHWEAVAEWSVGITAPVSVRFGPQDLRLAAGCGSGVTVFTCRDTRPIQPHQEWQRKIKDDRMKEVVWTAASDMVIGRTRNGAVWRFCGEEVPQVLVKSDATAIAVPNGGVNPRWVAVMTRQSQCILVNVDTAEVFQSFEINHTVCCSVVTRDNVLFALSCDDPGALLRLRLEGEDKKVDGSELDSDVLEVPAVGTNGLMSKIEALANPTSKPSEQTEQEKRRLGELAATRIRGQLDELIHCSAFCCPDLEHLASTLLELHLDMTAK